MNHKDTPLTLLTRVILGFVGVNALLGALSLILFPANTNDLFFWEITPPINAALFGALYLGGAVVVGWVTLRGSWEQARFLVPVLVSAGFFISVTTILHLDRFTPGIKLIYWFVIYIGAPILALALFIYYERRGASWHVEQPITRSTRIIATVIGAVILTLGILLLISPAPAVSYWPWTITPLMLRIFASWFSAFGVGLLWFLVERDWRRLQNIANLMITASALDLLMIFLHRDDLIAGSINIWIYCFHLMAFGVIGLLMHWLQRKSLNEAQQAHAPSI